jgi:hypothetical protein
LTKEKEPPPQPSTTVDPADATGLQDGVADAIVDFELVEQGGMVKIPQVRRKKRVVFKY